MNNNKYLLTCYIEKKDELEYEGNLILEIIGPNNTKKETVDNENIFITDIHIKDLNCSTYELANVSSYFMRISACLYGRKFPDPIPLLNYQTNRWHNNLRVDIKIKNEIITLTSKQIKFILSE